MLGHELGHFEHADLFLAAEDSGQVCISIDVGLDLLVLQTVFLDVSPKLFRQFSPGQRLAADDGRQGGVRLDWFHECSVWGTLGLFRRFRCWFALFRCSHARI